MGDTAWNSKTKKEFHVTTGGLVILFIWIYVFISLWQFFSNIFVHCPSTCCFHIRYLCLHSLSLLVPLATASVLLQYLIWVHCWKKGYIFGTVAFPSLKGGVFLVGASQDLANTMERTEPWWQYRNLNTFYFIIFHLHKVYEGYWYLTYFRNHRSRSQRPLLLLESPSDARVFNENWQELIFSFSLCVINHQMYGPLEPTLYHILLYSSWNYQPCILSNIHLTHGTKCLW